MEEQGKKAASLGTIQAVVKQHLDSCKAEYELPDGPVDQVVLSFVNAVQARKHAFQEQISTVSNEKQALQTQLQELSETHKRMMADNTKKEADLQGQVKQYLSDIEKMRNDARDV